jgi:hypothetical protein
MKRHQEQHQYELGSHFTQLIPSRGLLAFRIILCSELTRPARFAIQARERGCPSRLGEGVTKRAHDTVSPNLCIAFTSEC